MDFSGLYRVDHRKKKGRTTIFFKSYFLPFFLVFVAAFLIQLTLRSLLLFPVKLDTNSMSPALARGSRVFLTYPHLATIAKDSLVQVRRDGLDLFCRVVATEGNIVQVIDKSLFINHKPVKDYSGSSKDKTIFPENVSRRDNTGEFLVGPRQYFCLNDNWENTQDSRSHGAISFDEIRGKVLFKGYLGFR